MELFLKRSRGSITVLVTLILVPTIFFTGFLTDLSRLKLCGNQAVMAADNYGETVLTQYDNLLKELYGLFAVTQNEDGRKALDDLQAYMKTSFDPSANGINWNHLEAVQDFAGINEVKGFMPYRSATVEMSYEFPENANLGDNIVLATQVGDFMRFRIAEQLVEENTDLLSMLETVSNMEKDAEAIDAKTDLDEKVKELLELTKEYYDILKDIAEYPNYVDGINGAYQTCNNKIEEILASEAYKHYKDYMNEDSSAIAAALSRREEVENAEDDDDSTEETGTDGSTSKVETPAKPKPAPLTDDEKRLCEIADAYNNDPEARKDRLAKKFDDAVGMIEDAAKKDPIHFGNYQSKIESLLDKASKIAAKGQEIKTLEAQLEEILESDDITEKLKNGLKRDLEEMQKLLGGDQIQLYTTIANYINTKDTPVNGEYETQVGKIVEKLEEVADTYLQPNEYEGEYEPPLDAKKWSDFQDVERQKELYDKLVDTFGKGGDEKEGNKKKDQANKMLEDAQNALKGESFVTNARDIPESFGYGSVGNEAGFKMKSMIKDAKKLFSANGFKSAGNQLLLKVYAVQYDFGMFSSRVTNIKTDDEEDQEPAVSLTGYEMSKRINYLYQAELEYLLGGNNSSKKNLESARNKILAIRAVVNFTATYSISEIDKAIRAIQDAATAVNPLLGAVVGGALRLAVTGVETAADWNELKSGESVILIKQEMGDLTALDTFAGLLNISDTNLGEESKDKDGDLCLNYEQYLKLMIVFLTTTDEVMNRTRNLIELNVNAADAGLGEDDNLTSLTFHMKDAHTAVDATCTVHLDFLVMPDGFARKVATSEDYNSLMEFEKNSYKFTVTRGY